MWWGDVMKAEHGIVCRLPGERFGYFGWPTVARVGDGDGNGTLLVASSGLRSEHICPWGKTVLNASTDDGRTWSPPRVINDSPLDDRDAGILDLGAGRLLVSWFTSDTRQYAQQDWVRSMMGAEEVDSWGPTLSQVTDVVAQEHIGSWVSLSADGGDSWGERIRVPVSAPHGPIRLRNGDLLYLGKPYGSWSDMDGAPITAARSTDGGCSWQILGQVPCHPATGPANYHEPHVVELPTGCLLGLIRIEDHGGERLAASGIPSFSLMQTESTDGGFTWTTARPLGFHGSPPHLLRHSSGKLIATYGYRQALYGQRAAFSNDDGATWEHDWVIRDDGPDGDLGYPSTVELADGALFTVCYQKVAGDAKCSLLWSRWMLP